MIARRPKVTGRGWWALTMLAACSFYIWVSWRQVPGILFDQGWFLQVSRRVASGEILYRDVLWPYGPLPVLIMSSLMRLGSQDIMYFTLINVWVALFATLAVYDLHRYSLSPRASAIATIVVMIPLGGFLVFSRAYTPGVALGALAAIFTLSGLLKAFNRGTPVISATLVGLGLGGSLLAKQEFAFASLTLCLVLLTISLRFDEGLRSNSSPARPIVAGVLGGLLLASAVYVLMSRTSGWSNLFNAMTGYSVLQARGVGALHYDGLRSLAPVLAALFLSVSGIAALVLVLNQNLAKRTRHHLKIIALTSGGLYLLGAVSWQSGWIHAVQLGETSWLDAGSLLSRALASPSDLAVFGIAQARIALGFSLLLLFGVLALRWAKRSFGRLGTRFQGVACFSIAGLILLSGLREVGVGLSPLAAALSVSLYAFLPAEFPSLRLAPQSSRAAVLTLVAILLFFTYSPWPNWHATVGTSSFETPYGAISIYDSIAPFLSRVVNYVQTDTTEDDSIGVIGPLPGIYYLSQRENPFYTDYLSPGLGDDEAGVDDYLSRFERRKPALVFVLLGDWESNVLQASPYLVKRPGGPLLFGSASTRVERYLLDHYRVDKEFRLDSSYRLLALRRIS